jgi:hypothetical protein
VFVQHFLVYYYMYILVHYHRDICIDAKRRLFWLNLTLSLSLSLSIYIYILLSTCKHKVEKIVQLGYNATSAHVICIFLSFPFFFFSSSFSKTSDVAGRQYDVEAAF